LLCCCRPRDFDLNEFHAKATRTLFVGNISREVVPAEIHERFKEFGEILEIDIKKPDYALVQFVDIDGLPYLYPVFRIRIQSCQWIRIQEDKNYPE
jgi:hypothetical protein